MKANKALIIPSILLGMLLSGCPNPDVGKDDTVKVTGVSLNQESYTLDINQTLELIATVNPTDATNKSVTWSTSQSDVATVSDGVVTALSGGTATITVTTVDGGFTDTCLVTVNEPSAPITINFTNNVASYVTARLDKTSALENEEVTVTLSNPKDGYTLSDYTLKDAGGQIIPIVSQTTTTIKFNMPSTGNIYLDATVVGNPIKVFLTDTKSLISSNPSYKAIGSETWTEVAPVTDASGKYVTVPYGSDVRISIADSGYIEATGITLDGIPVAKQADKDYVEFKATLDDVSDFWFEVTVTYVDNTPVTGDYTFVIKKTSHVKEVKLLNSTKTLEVRGANQNDVVYVTATLDEGYSIRKVTLNVPNDDLGHYNVVDAIKENDGYFKFTTPYAKYNTITVNVEESNDTALKDCEAVGSYVGVVIAPYSQNAVINEISNTAKTEITLNGNCTFGVREEVIDSFTSTHLITADSSHAQLPYGNDFLLWNGDSNTYIRPPFGSYDYLCVKKKSADDPDSMYTAYGEKIVFNGVKVDVVEFYRDGVSYAKAMLNETAKEAYFGVKINFLNGSAINDALACYEVLDANDNVLAVVGSDDTGGYRKRCLLSDHFGTYTSNDLSLSIFGSTKATYKNEEFSYSYTGNQITLTTSTKTVVATLDDANRTFVVTSEVEQTLVLPAFAGKKYRTSDLEDDLAYYNFYVEFSSADLKLSCVGGCDYNLDMTHCTTQKFGYNVDVDYTYDETTKVVTATIEIKGGAMKAVKFTYNSSNNTFTFKTTDVGPSLYSGTATLREIK